MKVKNLLALTKQRLERTQQQQGRLKSSIHELDTQRTHIRTRITALHPQILLHEKADELHSLEFWERQRLKAAVLADIAHFEYQIDTLTMQIEKYEQIIAQLAQQAFILRNKCEKFQNYLKQQRRIRCLKLARQQENEIEELFVHGDN